MEKKLVLNEKQQMVDLNEDLVTEAAMLNDQPSVDKLFSDLDLPLRGGSTGN